MKCEECKYLDKTERICYYMGENRCVDNEEQTEDAISRKSIKQKLQEHHDFLVNAYGGFSNLPQNDKSRVDEITNCIAMVVNEPPVNPYEPKTGHWIPVSERLPLLRGSCKISDDVLITNGYENDMGYLVKRKGQIFWHYYGSNIEVGINDEDNDATAGKIRNEKDTSIFN